MYAVVEGLIHFMCVGVICCIIGHVFAADDYYPLKIFVPCDDTCHKIEPSVWLGFTVPDAQARVTCIFSWLPSGITPPYLQTCNCVMLQ